MALFWTTIAIIVGFIAYVMHYFWTLIAIIIGLVAYLTNYLKTQRNFWLERGIPHKKPHFLYGTVEPVVKQTQHFDEVLSEIYKSYKHAGPFAGMHLFIRPTCLLTDMDLIKAVLIRDFDKFSERELFHNEKDDPLTANLFALDGEKWKSLRTKLSPTLSGDHMRDMFPTVLQVGEQLTKVLNEQLRHHAQFTAVLEITELCARYTTDVIGSCAFGLECNSLKNPDADFRRYGKRIFNEQRHKGIFKALIMSFPKMARRLRMRTIHNDINQFFMRVVSETIKLRELENIQRNDYMNLLLELKRKGELSVAEMTAQTFAFFTAGFETTMATIAHALYELALNPKLQEKLRQEITEVLERNNKEFTYESIKQMEYLEMVIKETLRKYPIVGNLTRKSLTNYRTMNLNFIIPKGCQIYIPVAAIHHDPEYYPKPEIFDPLRFTHAEIQKRHAAAWLPFGDGPRNCIGMHFAQMQISISLAKLVNDFRFKKCRDTVVPLKFKKDNNVLAAEGGIRLQVEPAWWSE